MHQNITSEVKFIFFCVDYTTSVKNIIFPYPDWGRTIALYNRLSWPLSTRPRDLDPDRLHRVHKCGIYLTNVARSVVCVSVCVLGVRVSCAKTAERIESPFGGEG